MPTRRGAGGATDTENDPKAIARKSAASQTDGQEEIRLSRSHR